MKLIHGALVASLLTCVWAAQAGVIVGGTRLIYDGSKKEASLSVSNPDKSSYLVQTWVETPDSATDKAPFMVTPPLFRLDGGQKNVLRVVRAGGNLASDKETLYWMNIKAIPSMESNQTQNTLQIAIKTRIKLIFRPQGVKGAPEDVADKLVWHRSGHSLQVTNPTPFYMNFMEIKVTGKPVSNVTYVAPGTTASFDMPEKASGTRVSWKVISDYGAVGAEHQGSF
ncbi:fimbrial biogenesis chaperone [Rahnella bonaserana]